VAACASCGKDTELYYHGLPVCVDCSDVVPDHILPEHKAVPENSSVETVIETSSPNESVE